MGQSCAVRNQAGVVALALAVIVGGCGDSDSGGDEWSGWEDMPDDSVAPIQGEHGGLNDRQENARRLIREFVEAYVADVAPQDAGQRTDTTDDSDCRTGTRLVHRVVLAVPENEHAEVMEAFERYWRETWQEEIRATGDEVAISSSSDWSTRIGAGDDGLEVVGQTACIP